MTTANLALRLIPAALPKLTEDGITASLEALAGAVGLNVQRLMRDYGHHVVAKYLSAGARPSLLKVC